MLWASGSISTLAWPCFVSVLCYSRRLGVVVVVSVAVAVLSGGHGGQGGEQEELKMYGTAVKILAMRDLMNNAFMYAIRVCVAVV